MITFIINSKVMGGKNHIGITRTGHRYPLPSWAKWRDGVVQILRNLCIETIHYPCKITIGYWRADERKRDLPGMIDALFHCFERAGIVQDDFQFKDLHWLNMGIDRKDPRVVIAIEEIR